LGPGSRGSDGLFVLVGLLGFVLVGVATLGRRRLLGVLKGIHPGSRPR
jgi:hypothetical protein